MDVGQEFIGRSSKMAVLREQLHTLMARETGLRRLPPLLITGETGTGKGLLARIIHRASSRSSGEFVDLNSSAIPEHLLESELFGYERGAFTDARQSKAGLLQVAHRGTLFLDEVGLLPLSLQAKLLKVLEEEGVRRLGSTRSEPIDVCIISATNEDLRAAVRARRFREDLYHRLAGITLWIPPLRDRAEDIDLLAAHALEHVCAKYSVPLKQLSPDARTGMKAYRWPGNVRELNRVIERAVLFCPGPVIPVTALELGSSPAIHTTETPAGVNPADWERWSLSEALAQTGWNISRTAAFLDITRNTVRARIAKYGLRPTGRAEQLAAERTDDAPGALDVATAEQTKEFEVSSGPPSSLGVGAVAPPLDRFDASRGRPSIAVLTFNVEGDDASSYFGDGIVEDIIGALASLRELLVISRSSTLRYRGGGVDVRTIGRDLGVAYALSGSVRRAGSRLRVSVELAETKRGTVIWASHFDGASEDLFALQDQITTRVVGTLAPQVREAELRRALRKRPESMEAYDCVLRALAQIYRLNRDDFTEARVWLEKATALDPTYAAPCALLAIWHSIRVSQGWSPDYRADLAEVIRLANAAIERDSFDAMALVLCGHAKSLLLYEFDDAIALFDRALAASPSSAIAWTRSSPTYSYIGDSQEAIRRAEHGLRLSPFDPHIFYAHTILGLAHYVAGDYEEAARWGRKAREENPQFTANLRLLAASLAAGGHVEDACEVGRALLSVQPDFDVGSFVERYAIRVPERRDRFARQLRLAGLPG